MDTKDNLLYGISRFYKDGTPISKCWMLDDKEVAPGCWFPMTQGYGLYHADNDGENYLDSRRDIKVTEVKVNEKLSDSLFTVDFQEGVRVVDLRFGGLVTYPYKANRTQEEWAEIGERARKRAESDTEGKQRKDALIGHPAPPFPQAATWLNSEPLSWQDLRGKVVILDFWADWCGPCRNDLPHMNAFHEERETSDIVVIGIHTLGSELESINKIMKKFDLKYPICIDLSRELIRDPYGEMSNQYQVNMIPYAYVIDKQGRVAGHGLGVSYVMGKAHELIRQKDD